MDMNTEVVMFKTFLVKLLKKALTSLDVDLVIDKGRIKVIISFGGIQLFSWSKDVSSLIRFDASISETVTRRGEL